MGGLLSQFGKFSHSRTFIVMQEMSRFMRFGSKKYVNPGLRAKKTEFAALLITLIWLSSSVLSLCLLKAPKLVHASLHTFHVDSYESSNCCVGRLIFEILIDNFCGVFTCY